jgi:tetratricopeptide (TPR) repeat protein
MADKVLRCSECRSEVDLLWTFCPACGAGIERPAQLTANAEPDELAVRALRLLSDGRPAEAESVLALGIDAAGTEARVVYARLLGDRGDFQGARIQLDEAVARDPSSFTAHVRRCELFARVGLYGEAVSDARAARRLAPDVASLLHVHELERRLGELSKHSFTRQNQLPAMPAWLGVLKSRFKKSPARAGL